MWWCCIAIETRYLYLRWLLPRYSDLFRLLRACYSNTVLFICVYQLVFDSCWVSTLFFFFFSKTRSAPQVSSITHTSSLYNPSYHWLNSLTGTLQTHLKQYPEIQSFIHPSMDNARGQKGGCFCFQKSGLWSLRPLGAWMTQSLFQAGLGE